MRRSRTIRAFSNLTFTFPGYPPDRVNASSLLCRREAVTEVIGDGFDDVRKAADDEFYGRLEAVAPGSLLDLPMRRPLAIKQIRDDSLSRADALPGWLAWTRLAYRNAYTFWHSQISLSGASASLSVGGSRSIPSPDPSWDPVSADRAPRRPYDTVIINDWRPSCGDFAVR